MGWFRKMVLKIMKDDIEKNGVKIGRFTVKEADGKLTVKTER